MRAAVCGGCGATFDTEARWSPLEACPKCAEELDDAGLAAATPAVFTGHLLRKYYSPKRTLEDRFIAMVAAELMARIVRLRAALSELERWTGQAMPEHVHAMLEPGDLYDVGED